MSAPKSHHFISKFLLRKFASRDGLLLVHRLDGGQVFKSQPANVGSETHGYRVSEDFAEDPVVYERHMSSLEAEASVAIQALQESSELTVPSHLREVLVRFFVLHAFRHRELRDRVRDETVAENREVLESLGRNPVREVMNWVVAAQSVPALGEGYPVESDGRSQMAAYFEHFESLEWRVIRFREPSLVVGDRLVCMSGLRGSRSGGVSYAASLEGRAGLAWSRRVTVPLSPTCGLLLSRNAAVGHLGAKEFNKTTVLNAREFVAHTTDWHHQQPALARSLERNLEIRRMDG